MDGDWGLVRSEGRVEGGLEDQKRREEEGDGVVIVM